ncbi:MAG: hypothetical protein ACE5E5_10645 [Phycisphaerae bacterium]
MPKPLPFHTGPGFTVVLLVSLLGTTLPAPPAYGQSGAPPNTNRKKASATAEEAPPPADDTREHLTAADVLRALRRQRPENKIIAPAGRGPNWNSAPQDTLFPEGFALVNQSGTLTKEGDWWVFHFAKGSGISPMKLLPSANAEPMIRSVAQSPEPFVFKVSGETTVFEGENFLLLHLALRDTAAPLKERRPDQQASNAGRPDVSETKTPEARLDQPAPPASDGNVDDIMATLEAQKPSGDPITFTATSSALQPVDADQSRPGLLPEGTAIIDRPARLVQRGNWWTLVFESDSADGPEPPIKLLPNSNLQTMTTAAKEEPNGLVFVVSGQVTIFDGENYLLARAVRRRVSGGNLRK